MIALSKLLATASPSSELLRDIKNAEALAPGLLATCGVDLVYGPDDAGLYTIVIDQLSKADRENYERGSKALESCAPIKDTNPMDIACDIYTPQIAAAYHLGLAMGFGLARTISRR
ncbi:MAG: hypothetical protein WBD07_18305 [Vicinamibacterales bacterium]